MFDFKSITISYQTCFDPRYVEHYSENPLFSSVFGLSRPARCGD